MTRMRPVRRRRWPFFVAAGLLPAVKTVQVLVPATATDGWTLAVEIILAAGAVVVWFVLALLTEYRPNPSGSHVDVSSALGLTSPPPVETIIGRPMSTAGDRSATATSQVPRNLTARQLFNTRSPWALWRGIALWVSAAAASWACVRLSFFGVEGDAAVSVLLSISVVLLGVGLTIALAERGARRRDPVLPDGTVRRPYDPGFLWITTPLTLSAGAVAIALLSDDEVTALPLWRFLRLLLLTALCEELVFRASLLSWGFRVLSPRAASMVAAASFGLWFTGDGWSASRGVPGSEWWHRVLVTAMFVAIAYIGALILTWCRIRTRGIYGPILLRVAVALPGLAYGAQITW